MGLYWGSLSGGNWLVWSYFYWRNISTSDLWLLYFPPMGQSYSILSWYRVRSSSCNPILQMLYQRLHPPYSEEDHPKQKERFGQWRCWHCNPLWFISSMKGLSICRQLRMESISDIAWFWDEMRHSLWKINMKVTWQTMFGQIKKLREVSEWNCYISIFCWHCEICTVITRRNNLTQRWWILSRKGLCVCGSLGLDSWL